MKTHTEGDLLVHIARVNEDKGWTVYDEREPLDDWWTELDEHELRGELYRHALREYGRCTGKVYVDTDDGAKAVGWVFVKREHYSEPYLCTTWVMPERVTRAAMPTQVASVEL